jgi:Putative Actinobacterial Holin-X, holin superfamily III
MLAPSSDLLRAGLGLKLNQVKRATRSYIRDRTNQATGSVTSYAVAAGLFAASGIFLIAACLVGLVALFRWVEIHYGMFPAFGVIGALLLVIAIICAALAAARLKRPPPRFPSLTSRLRVAITASPLRTAPTQAMQDTAASLMPASSASVDRAGANRFKPAIPPRKDNRQIQAGLILAATLLGWAAVRRKNQNRRIDV